MKIGIFGDSFGDDSEKPVGYTSWIDILKQQHDVKNFSQGGCSVWFLYQNILKNYDQFDKIIFLVTEPQRITIPAHSPIMWKHMTISFSENLKNKPHESWYSEKHIKGIDVLYNYYTQIHDFDMHEKFAELMLKDLQANYKNIIYYPCFHHSPYTFDDVPLVVATDYELSQLNIKNKPKDLHHDARVCHFKENNHHLIAQLFLDRINGINSKLDISKFELASEPIEKYFRHEAEVCWVK